MSESQFIDLLQQTIWMMLMLSAPVLVSSLVIGVLISIFQAVTQIQETTLSFVPKIIIAMLVLVVTAPWMLQTMVDHTQKLFISLSHVTH